ncbi:hypothetical protein HDU89_007872 [Geranomyces variabilis]|nr:hypothetical protein HDU89_007872 [Geranomyces variabilis]
MPLQSIRTSAARSASVTRFLEKNDTASPLPLEQQFQRRSLTPRRPTAGERTTGSPSPAQSSPGEILFSRELAWELPRLKTLSPFALDAQTPEALWNPNAENIEKQPPFRFSDFVRDLSESSGATTSSEKDREASIAAIETEIKREAKLPAAPEALSVKNPAVELTAAVAKTQPIESAVTKELANLHRNAILIQAAKTDNDLQAPEKEHRSVKVCFDSKHDMQQEHTSPISTAPANIGTQDKTPTLSAGHYPSITRVKLKNKSAPAVTKITLVHAVTTTDNKPATAAPPAPIAVTARPKRKKAKADPDPEYQPPAKRRKRRKRVRQQSSNPIEWDFSFQITGAPDHVASYLALMGYGTSESEETLSQLEVAAFLDAARRGH